MKKFLMLLALSTVAFADPTNNVTYFGGPVISHVKIHVVYWGGGIDAALKAPLEQFYGAVVNSTFIDQLAEYDTPTQKIGRGTISETLTIQPTHTATQLTTADIEQELETQIQNGVLPKPDADSLYMLHFPDSISINISFGASCADWYADHEVYKSPNLGNVYYAMFPCDSTDLSNFDELTSAAAHELAESITDPASPLNNAPVVYPAGWIRSDGQEIADLCTATPATLTAGNQTFNMQGVWLNSLGGCNPAANFSSP